MLLIRDAFIAQKLERVRQNRQHDFQAFAHALGIAGQVDNERLPAHTDYGAREHGVARFGQAICANGFFHAGHAAFNYGERGFGRDVAAAQARAARG